MKFLSKLLDTNAKEIKKLEKIVSEVNSHSKMAEKLKDADFPKKTKEFKERIEKGEKLEQILPEAFAVAREASYRAIGLKHYDVQLMASAALFMGNVSEQKTGEGKTISAVPALYLRALAGKGAHLVTVNDYLARRDAGWNAPTFHFLGLSLGVIATQMKSYLYDPEFTDSSHGDERLAHLKPVDRKEAYKADVTYGTNNEFGFDYLRDNMVNSLDQMVQRGHYFAIVDEVDSVLIDEARTPLIISAPDTEPTDKYYRFAKLIQALNVETDFTIDEKSKSASLTEHGVGKIEKMLGVTNLYEHDFDSIHHIENALRARSLYLRDREYVVKDNEVIIVDEFTGRLMPGRRWSDGLHQAVEAKEGVSIQQESRTLATISYQNYFRMYEVLSGMTGTAATESAEFRKIYKINVVVIPTHKKNIRDDMGDIVYKTFAAKYTAIADEIEKRHKAGQPVLVGTTSIEKNELLGKLLSKRKIPHNLLNAKNHEQEAAIIADAGKPGAVTVATNMAGRGVDIILGGAAPERKTGESIEKFKESKAYKAWQKAHDQVASLGGLHVIGSERHESRRIDNQLRGRAGRQGDPGSTRFYLSLEDDLMRIFGGENMKNMMDKLRLPDDQPIENGLISRAIEQSQVKVEGFHFDSRKNVVEYDDVANQQREIIYGLRKRILGGENMKEEILRKLDTKIEGTIATVWPEYGEKPDFSRIAIEMAEMLPMDDASRQSMAAHLEKIDDKVKLEEELKNIVRQAYESRETQVGDAVARDIERFVYLGAIDRAWMDHIDQIDHLRDAVRLRGYGQRDPLVEFKNEAFELFETMIVRVDNELVTRIFRVGVMEAPANVVPLDLARTNEDTKDGTGLLGTEKDEIDSGAKAFSKDSSIKSKIGRNDPCWCGSGKKWKHCHYPKTS